MYVLLLNNTTIILLLQLRHWYPNINISKRQIMWFSSY